ncbi:MAG: EAL domain-containing protein [Xanthobacteraceae bacterium]
MLTLLNRDCRPNLHLPDEIYVSLVDSLFVDAASMLAGALCATIAGILIAWKIDDWRFWGIAVALALVGMARAGDMNAYARRVPPPTAAATRTWEIRYALGVGAYTSLLGLWCFLAITTTRDPAVHLLCTSVTIGYVAAGIGRNCGRSHIVSLQIICACAPLALALLLHDDAYYKSIGCLIILLFVGVKRISASLHETKMRALCATREAASLATRFNTALNNMPHGLCMFDRERRVVVSNRRLGDLLGVGRDIVRRHVSVRELLLECVPAGTVTSCSPERLLDLFDGHLSGRGSDDLVVEIRGDRALAFTFQPMESGGSVVLIEDVTYRRNAEAKIAHMARYDALTGLPNRSYFHDQMDRFLADPDRRTESWAVMFVDLDHFKQINDTLGHAVGDHLLCAVADRLRGIVRESDVISRFGGDEFIVLQSPISKPEEAATLARRIIDVVSEPYRIDGHRLVIAVSIGIAVTSDAGVTAEILLQNADMALYRAKFDGRGTWRFFEPEMEVRARARRDLETDLRNALGNDAFEIHYQPLYELKTRSISTCEALLRWPHRERGMISPAEFIPVAEEMGLIVDLGRWVLQRACQECTRWPNRIRVAVNLSPVQFARGDVVADIHEALTMSGLPANRLEVEITESVLLLDTQATRAALLRLRDDGVRISLDDFGTGYSSLSYLHSLPLHKVKIDRSFLQGLGTDERSWTLLHGVARLSAELGLSVVIEGVETEQQLALIAAEHSIDEVQGFLLGMPTPGRQLRALLEAATTDTRTPREWQPRFAAAGGAVS